MYFVVLCVFAACWNAAHVLLNYEEVFLIVLSIVCVFLSCGAFAPLGHCTVVTFTLMPTNEETNHDKQL